MTLAARLNHGRQIAQEAQIDFAVPDVNLGGGGSCPIAGILEERGLPFLFATGYGIRGHDKDRQGRPTLRKPFGIDGLAKAIRQASSLGRTAWTVGSSRRTGTLRVADRGTGDQGVVEAVRSAAVNTSRAHLS